MATHAMELSKALAALGHQVVVLTASALIKNQSRFMLRKEEKTGGIQIIQLGAVGIFRTRQINFQVARYLRQLSGKYESDGNTVLHLHELHRPPIIRVLTGLPLVWTNHSSGFLKEYADHEKHETLRQELAACDWVTAPSNELKEKTVTVGYPPERVVYIPNGVDTRFFKPPDGKFIHTAKQKVHVICARRFVEKNGLHIYMDALEQLDEPILSQCVFVFAGNPEKAIDAYARNILQRIERLSKRANVSLLGHVSNTDMADVYRASDISVLPSLMEATSITGLESMACGLPIVGTNVGGISEIVEHEVNGLLCSPNSPSELAVNLASLVTSPEKRIILGMAGRKKALDKFSWHIIAKQYVEVYCNAKEWVQGSRPNI